MAETRVGVHHPPVGGPPLPKPPIVRWARPTRGIRTGTCEAVRCDSLPNLEVAAMYNLRNRSFLKEIDFEPNELRFLLQLSEALKIAKYSGAETKRLAGKEIALIFE